MSEAQLPQSLDISGWYAKIDNTILYDKSSQIYRSPQADNNYFVQFNVSSNPYLILTIRIWFYIEGGKIKYTLTRQSSFNNETVTGYKKINEGIISDWEISKPQIKLSYISKTKD